MRVRQQLRELQHDVMHLSHEVAELRSRDKLGPLREAYAPPPQVPPHDLCGFTADVNGIRIRCSKLRHPITPEHDLAGLRIDVIFAR